MSYRFVTVDVFTNKRFAGNQLAVLPEADGLTTAQMQAIAREFNYAESTFVLPPEHADNDARVRIFTPHAELPFAGHPNIGTAFVLAASAVRSGRTEAKRQLRFEEGAGLVSVDVEYEGGDVVYCELTAPEPLAIDQPIDTKDGITDLAGSLSIDADDILTSNHAPCRASVGLPFLVTELASLSALERATLRADLFAPIAERHDLRAVHLYTRADAEADVDIQCRMFAPKLGVVEDPATGSANCALAGLLAKVDEENDGVFSYRIEQGVQIARPSLLKASVDKVGGEIERVRIGGASVMVASGQIEV